MFEEIDSTRVTQYQQEKALLETELGRRMFEIFNRPPVIGMLQDFVRPAIEQLAALATRTTDGATSKVTLGREIYEMRTAIAGESNLAAWRGRSANPENLVWLAGQSHTWTAYECSDLIRLYVTVTEHLTQKAGTGRYTFPQDPQGRRRPKAVPGSMPGYQDIGGALKATRPDFHGDPHVWKEDRARKGMPGTGIHPQARDAVLSTARSTAPGPGIRRYILEPRSTTRKIDLVFGLPPGADISGTTADSIFFMESVDSFLRTVGGPRAAAHNLGPMLQLLAPATMVALGHHTVLESALTLTLNGIINYSIGYYSTMMPSDAPRNELWARLDSLFLWAENHPWNHRMLCFYDLGLKAYVYGEGGGPQTPWQELNAFKELAKTSLDFLGEFRTYPAQPTRARVDAYRQDFGL